ncbi:hypothetical protein H6G06_17105 [Anabaena sphaerica FACHB-251]|uniref:Uncharacterized protein n=1 Tax=Anabaena sphaerica FACHB-251 TaxID=2692883 RepID=A0A926WKJ8_9NOST|nr:hypothetical protein [Anabaena sphaerica]MBD2295151.1 hypothetical protein [Anabaena sphaerica FACHB-251]
MIEVLSFLTDNSSKASLFVIAISRLFLFTFKLFWYLRKGRNLPLPKTLRSVEAMENYITEYNRLNKGASVLIEMSYMRSKLVNIRGFYIQDRLIGGYMIKAGTERIIASVSAEGRLLLEERVPQKKCAELVCLWLDYKNIEEKRLLKSWIFLCSSLDALVFSTRYNISSLIIGTYHPPLQREWSCRYSCLYSGSNSVNGALYQVYKICHIDIFPSLYWSLGFLNSNKREERK